MTNYVTKKVVENFYREFFVETVCKSSVISLKKEEENKHKSLIQDLIC